VKQEEGHNKGLQGDEGGFEGAADWQVLEHWSPCPFSAMSEKPLFQYFRLLLIRPFT
jgi:hypothetical protein